jgi:hypothetical protein
MRQIKLMVLTGVVTAMLLTGWAHAQGKPAQSGQGTPMMGCQERFDTLDANHDGKVSQEEFAAIPHYRGNAEQMFKNMDRDGDGVLSKDEFCAGKGSGKGMGKGMPQ